MLVIADSKTTSLIPAASSLPTGWLRSIKISICKPLFFNNTDDGFSSSLWYPTNLLASFKPTFSPLLRVTCNVPFSTAYCVASLCEPDASGTLSS